MPIETHKPARSTFAVFAVIWGALVLLGVAVATVRHDWSFPVLWVALAGWAFTGVTLSRIRLEWTNDEIVYQGVLHTRRVSFADISKVTFKPQSLRSGPFTLSIFGRNSSTPIQVNIKIFSASTLNSLRRCLESKGIALVS